LLVVDGCILVLVTFWSHFELDGSEDGEILPVPRNRENVYSPENSLSYLSGGWVEYPYMKTCSPSLESVTSGTLFNPWED
jgi:hypothetical protein